MSSADNPKLQMCVVWRNAKQNNTLPLMVYFHGFQFVDHSLLMGWEIFSGSQLKKRREEVHLLSYLVRFVVSRHPPSVYKSEMKLKNSSAAKKRLDG